MDPKMYTKPIFIKQQEQEQEQQHNSSSTSCWCLQVCVRKGSVLTCFVLGPVERGNLHSLSHKSIGVVMLIGVFDYAIDYLEISIDNSGNRAYII